MTLRIRLIMLCFLALSGACAYALGLEYNDSLLVKNVENCSIFYSKLANPTEDNKALVRWMLTKNPECVSWTIQNGPNNALEYLYDRHVWTADTGNKADFEELINLFYEHGVSVLAGESDLRGKNSQLGASVLEVWNKAAKAVEDNDCDTLKTLLWEYSYLGLYPQPQTGESLFEQAIKLYDKEELGSIEICKMLLCLQRYSEQLKNIKNKDAEELIVAFGGAWDQAIAAIKAQNVSELDKVLKEYSHMAQAIDPSSKSTLLHEAALQVKATYDAAAGMKSGTIERREAYVVYARSVQTFAYLMRRGAICTWKDNGGESVASLMEDGIHPGSSLFKNELLARGNPSLDECAHKAKNSLYSTTQAMGNKAKPHRYVIAAGICGMLVIARLLLGGSKKGTKNNRVASVRH